MPSSMTVTPLRLDQEKLDFSKKVGCKPSKISLEQILIRRIFRSQISLNRISSQMLVSPQSFWDRRKTQMLVLLSNYVREPLLQHCKSCLTILICHSAMLVDSIGLLFRKTIPSVKLSA